ncbi:MAG: cytochrome c-type biogenesis protein CcmH [Magnetococcales bacterium]|nr:cytochrome c-type biogenesis protein CcmH [Magnetococcales bacterium]
MIDRWMSVWWGLWAVLGLMMMVGVSPATGTEVSPAKALSSEDPTEAKVRDIAKGLRCAVCQNQSVYESNSDLAVDMLKVIRRKVREGHGGDEIRQYFHARYGDYIYMEPTASGMNWIIWAGPFVGLLAGGIGLVMAIRRWRRVAPEAAESTDNAGEHSGEEESALQKRIRKEMERTQL